MKLLHVHDYIMVFPDPNGSRYALRCIKCNDEAKNWQIALARMRRGELMRCVSIIAAVVVLSIAAFSLVVFV